VEIHAIAPGMTPEVRARIDEISSAVEGQRRLVLQYSDVEVRPTERIVRRLAFWFWDKV